MHLSELSPPVLRAFFYGVTYQLGNLASSASSTIEATIGERFPLAAGPDGESRYDYGKVIGNFPPQPSFPFHPTKNSPAQASSSAPSGPTSCSSPSSGRR